MARARSSTQTVATTSDPQDLIHEIREEKVILDSDLAHIYGVSTKRLNEQVKRNQERFPGDFMFRLTAEESAALKVAICDRFPKSIAIHVYGPTPLPNMVPSWLRMS